MMVCPGDVFVGLREERYEREREHKLEEHDLDMYTPFYADGEPETPTARTAKQARIVKDKLRM
jgi:hypothetical protein